MFIITPDKFVNIFNLVQCTESKESVVILFGAVFNGAECHELTIDGKKRE